MYTYFTEAFLRIILLRKLFIFSLKSNTPIYIISFTNRSHERRTSITILPIFFIYCLTFLIKFQKNEENCFLMLLHYDTFKTQHD